MSGAMSDFGLRLKAERERLLHQLIRSLCSVEAGEDNYELAMDFCFQNLDYHRFADTNPLQVSQAYDELEERMGRESQLAKQRALGTLRAALLRVQMPSDQLDAHHRILALLYALARAPLSSVYNPAAPSRQAAEAASRVDASDGEDSDAGSGAGSEAGSPWSSDDELSDWAGDEEEGAAGTLGQGEAQPAQHGGGAAAATAQAGGKPGGTAPPCAVRDVPLLTELRMDVEGPFGRGQLPPEACCGNVHAESVLACQVVRLLRGGANPGPAFAWDLGMQRYSTTSQSGFHHQPGHTGVSAWPALLVRFAEAGTVARRLQLCLCAAADAGTGGTACATRAALADAAAGLLRPGQRLLAALEARLLASQQPGAYRAPTLLQLEAMLQGVMHQQRLLLHVVEAALESGGRDSDASFNPLDPAGATSAAEASAHALSSLAAALEKCSAQSSPQGDSDAAAVLKLLAGALRPWAGLLAAWLADGLLHDPHQEFLACPGEALSPEAETFWWAAYGMRQTREGRPACPAFLARLADQILAAGKSAVLLRSHQHPTSPRKRAAAQSAAAGGGGLALVLDSLQQGCAPQVDGPGSLYDSMMDRLQRHIEADQAPGGAAAEPPACMTPSDSSAPCTTVADLMARSVQTRADGSTLSLPPVPVATACPAPTAAVPTRPNSASAAAAPCSAQLASRQPDQGAAGTADSAASQLLLRRPFQRRPDLEALLPSLAPGGALPPRPFEMWERWPWDGQGAAAAPRAMWADAGAKTIPSGKVLPATADEAGLRTADDEENGPAPVAGTAAALEATLQPSSPSSSDGSQQGAEPSRGSGQEAGARPVTPPADSHGPAICMRREGPYFVLAEQRESPAQHALQSKSGSVPGPGLAVPAAEVQSPSCSLLALMSRQGWQASAGSSGPVCHAAALQPAARSAAEQMWGGRHDSPAQPDAWLARAQRVTLPPVGLLLEACLAAPVAEQAERVGARLLGALLGEWGLARELAGLRNIFLLASPALHPFGSALFAHLDTGATLKDTSAYELELLLQQSLPASANEPLPQPQALSVSLANGERDARGGSPAPPDSAVPGLRLPACADLAALRLGVRARWPLSMVVDEGAAHQYNQILIFLLQVRWAKHSLEGGWRGGGRGAARADLLRQEMAAFVSALHQFVMDRLHHTECAALDEALAAARSLDEVTAAHASFLARAARQCLLAPDRTWGLLQAAVLRLLDLALHFGALQRILADVGEAAARRSAAARELLRLGADWRAQHRYLLRLLTTRTLQVGGQAELRQLVQRLNFNGFYPEAE